MGVSRGVAGNQPAERRTRCFVSRCAAAVESRGRVRDWVEVQQICERYLPQAIYLPPYRKRPLINLPLFLSFLDEQTVEQKSKPKSNTTRTVRRRA